MRYCFFLLIMFFTSCAFFEHHSDDFGKNKKYDHEVRVIQKYGRPDHKITDGYRSFFAYNYCPRSRNKQILWSIPTLGASLMFCPSERKKIFAFKARRLVSVGDARMSKYQFMGLAAGLSNATEHDDEEMTSKYSVLKCGDSFQRELYKKECAGWHPYEDGL